jgi:hypothetical protein
MVKMAMIEQYSKHGATFSPIRGMATFTSQPPIWEHLQHANAEPVPFGSVLLSAKAAIKKS